MTEKIRIVPHWQRHDVLVVIAALVLLGAGHIADRILSKPALIPTEQKALRFVRPQAWLPAASLSLPLPVIAARARGETPPAPDKAEELHVVYASPMSVAMRMEVSIVPQPRYDNVPLMLRFYRSARYGELYSVQDSEIITAAGRDWLRTTFRYAEKADKLAVPRVTTGIEYATMSGGVLYRVTFHGDSDTAQALASIIAPTLRLDPSAGEPSAKLLPEPTVPPRTDDARAVTATAAVIAADVQGGTLQPVAGGSGVILTADGFVLTNFHVLYDEDAQRLHDLFVVGRFRSMEREPELVCAGRPQRVARIRAMSDLALIRCEMNMDGQSWTPADWPTIALARAEELKPGDRIRILGYPDSGAGRLMITAGKVQGWTGDQGADGRTYIKTDAAIRTGSSGGAVVNERGQLIGIATAFRYRAEVTTDGSSPAPAPRLEQVGLVRPLESAAELIASTTGLALPGIVEKPEGQGDAAADSKAVSGNVEGNAEDDKVLEEMEAALAGDDVDGGDSGDSGDSKRPSDGQGEGVMVVSRVVDAANDAPIAGAMVIVLPADVPADEIDLGRLEEQALSWGQTDETGELALNRPVPRGERYTVAVFAHGFHSLIGHGALLLEPGTPAFFDPWGVIRLARR